MICPAPLQRGDAIAIVATARKVARSELSSAIRLLDSWGLRPIIGSSIGLENHQFAGTDEERAADFQTQLDKPDVKAIWCARGGYGTVRILDSLDFSALKKNPKWIIGYSDITALHAHLNQLGLVSLHAEMPALIDDKTADTARS